jgi:hypothetical protein
VRCALEMLQVGGVCVVLVARVGCAAGRWCVCGAGGARVLAVLQVGAYG